MSDFNNPWGKGSPDYERWMGGNPWAGGSEEKALPAARFKDVPDYVRLIFWGGASQTGHNATFRHAANRVNRDYSVKARMIEIIDGKHIVDAINGYTPDSIQSIDFFRHGGPKELYFRKIDGKDTDLHASPLEQEIDGATGNGKASNLEEIDLNVFTSSCKVEFHGCKAAENYSVKAYGTFFGQNTTFRERNICLDLSRLLFQEGKTNAVVIGHAKSANPNIDGQNTSNENQDYRHGLRIVYHNAAPLFITRKEGRITAGSINFFSQQEKIRGVSI